MTKTKELSILVFFLILGFLFLNKVLHAEETKVAPIELKCYKKEEFMKIINSENMFTIFNGEKTPSRTIEFMTAKDHNIYVVEYDSSKDGSAFQSKEYCVAQKITNPTFNDKFIEFLHEVLEKSKGQKT
jgi:hypothetical protein